MDNNFNELANDIRLKIKILQDCLGVIEKLEDHGLVPLGTMRIQESESPKPVTPTPKKRTNPASTGSKPCKKCGVVKPLPDFPINKGCVGGHTGTCKVCTYARAKKRNSSGDPAPPDVDAQHICEICHAIFGGPAQLRRHIEMKHNE